MRPDPLAGKYILECRHPECGKGRATVQMHLSAGWEIGTTVPMDPANQAHGRCPQCMRHSMVVVDAPKPPPPPPPKGFTKVPTK